MDDVATPPLDPFALPPTIPQIEVAPTPPPKRRRTGLLVAVGAVVVAAVVAGVVLLGGDKSDASYSLQAAATRAAEAHNVAFAMTMDAAGQRIEMTSRIDVDGGLFAISGVVPMLSDSAAVGIIMDATNEIMYMDASAFPGAEGMATKWVSVDLSKVPQFAITFDALTGTNPLDAARLFQAATDVQDKGVEDLNGEQVKHYVVTVDTAESIAAQPGLLGELDGVTTGLPETIVHDVWVTEDNELRRVFMEFEVDGQTARLDMTVTAVGTIEPIVLPAADDVTDITDMLPAG